MGWGSSTRRGGGRKLRARPRKFFFLGFQREESGMSREFCRDVPDPWGCSKISGPQKGPAERGHVKKRQKSSKSVKNIFDTFQHFSRGTNFPALLGGSEKSLCKKLRAHFSFPINRGHFVRAMFSI